MFGLSSRRCLAREVFVEGVGSKGVSDGSTRGGRWSGLGFQRAIGRFRANSEVLSGALRRDFRPTHTRFPTRSHAISDPFGRLFRQVWGRECFRIWKIASADGVGHMVNRSGAVLRGIGSAFGTFAPCLAVLSSERVVTFLTVALAIRRRRRAGWLAGMVGWGGVFRGGWVWGLGGVFGGVVGVLWVGVG
jgi:hypothetical protein